MFDLSWEDILFALAVIAYINDVFDLVGHIIDLVKAVVKGVKWMINKIHTATKK